MNCVRRRQPRDGEQRAKIEVSVVEEPKGSSGGKLMIGVMKLPPNVLLFREERRKG